MDIFNFLAQRLDIFLLLVAAISLLVGSFLNVVIYRLPIMLQHMWNLECREYLGLNTKNSDRETLSLHLPFSHCIQCKKTLKPWHNIPIISFLVLKGKCAYCHAKISLRYPLVELICCVASVYVAWNFGFSWQTLSGLLFTWIIIALTFIDLDYHLLPDHLTLLLVWIGLFLSIFNIFTNSTNAIIGGISGYLIFAIIQGIFKLLTGKIGMGQGDFKFLAGIGSFLGWQMLPIVIILASFCGMIFGITHMAIKRNFTSVPIPFGPYLAIAGWISLIWGQKIIELYFNNFIL